LDHGKVSYLQGDSVDILSIVEATLASTKKEETKGFAAPEWVTYSSSEELRKVWAEENG